LTETLRRRDNAPLLQCSKTVDPTIREEMRMTPEQYAAAQQAGLDAWFALARQQCSLLQAFCAAGVDATLDLTRDGLTQARALADARTVQDAVALTLAATPAQVEKLRGHARAGLTCAQRQHALCDEMVATQRAQTTSFLEQWSAESVPGGAQMTQVMRMASDTVYAAYESWSQQVRQMSETMVRTSAPTGTPA
jgi:hypothetical protein